jgi:hypothetical protein
MREEFIMRKRAFASDYRNQKRDHPDPFPVWKLKRVDRPTILINDDEVQRKDERNGGFPRAGRGEFGPFIEKEYPRFVMKSPLSRRTWSASASCRRTLSLATAGGMGSRTISTTSMPLAS